MGPKCLQMLSAIVCVYVIYLENINLILAFIINIISQPIELLNISSAFIVYTNTEMHMILFNTIDIYTAIMLIWLSVAYVAQWVEHGNIAHIFLSSALLVRIPYATFIIVTIEKAIVFIFITCSPFAISFLYFN